MARLSFRCDEELVLRVDAERGLIPREAWLRRAVEQALGETDRERSRQATTYGRGEPDTGRGAGRVDAVSPATSPAPAEQPSRPLPHYNEGDTLPPAKSQAFPPLSGHMARSSSQAKRGVLPVPKRGEKE